MTTEGKERSGLDAETERLRAAPLGDLIEHILQAYHRPLKEDLPRLESMARQVLEAHRDTSETMLSDLLATFQGLKAELEQHMAKEEQILFPMIQRGQGAMAEGPIAVMNDEHDRAESALARLRALTDDYVVPAAASESWRGLWEGLRALELALHRHIHLENDVLFPRALSAAP